MLRKFRVADKEIRRITIVAGDGVKIVLAQHGFKVCSTSIPIESAHQTDSKDICEFGTPWGLQGCAAQRFGMKVDRYHWW